MNAMNAINTVAVYAIFNNAYGVAVDLHEKMQEQGLGCRKDARPFAIEWAAKKFGETPYKGQRGITLVNGSTGYEAAEYVLTVCFPNPGVAGKKKSNREEPKTPSQKFATQAKTARKSGVTYRSALAALNKAWEM